MALIVKYKPDGTPVLVPEDGQEWKSYDELFGVGAWEKAKRLDNFNFRVRLLLNKILGVFRCKQQN